MTIAEAGSPGLPAVTSSVLSLIAWNSLQRYRYDRETKSLWYHDGLTAIHGDYSKQRLPKPESEDTRWKKWKQIDPGSKITE